jgi:hypothetical protein
MITIPENQAIKFLAEGENTFNSSDICGCNTDEKWNYKVTAGDDICFQMDSNCDESEEEVLNGSFEEGSSTTDFTDWVRFVANSETTNIIRFTDNNSPCGTHYAKWINTYDEPLENYLRQTITPSLQKGKTYKITLKARIVENTFPNNSNEGVLKVILGGQTYEITPTTSWAEYTIYASMVDVPSDNYLYLQLKYDPLSVVTSNISELHIDCASLVEFGECCVLSHINNGNFEDGQRQVGEIPAGFDNWTTGPSSGDVEESLTGGLNGSRCVILNAYGVITQRDTLLASSYYTLSFWAKTTVAPISLIIQTSDGSSLNIIKNQALTTDWALYHINFYNANDTYLIITRGSGVAQIYIDNVELSSRPTVDLSLYDTINETIVPIDSSDIVAYKGAMNVCFNTSNYEMPSCFRICVEVCIDNLLKNSDFSAGSNDEFSDWTLTQQTRTNYLARSKSFGDTSAWTPINVTIDGYFTDPFGGNDAMSIIPNFNNDDHNISQFITDVVGTTAILSVYAKFNDGPRYIVLYDSERITGRFFNIESGEIASIYGEPPIDSEIVNYGNGWYRCSITYDSGADLAAWIYAAKDDGETNFSGDGGSNIYIYQAQLETDTGHPTPNIFTTSGAETTSLGEFLAENNGIGDSRALNIWSNPNVSFRQTINVSSGVTYNVKLYAKFDGISTNNQLQINLGTQNLGLHPASDLTTDFQLIEFNFTSTVTGSQNFIIKYVTDDFQSFATIDYMIFTLASDITNQYCSENFGYYDELDPCDKELVWYDNEDYANGINYGSGFKNKMRISAEFQNPTYIKSDYSKTINGSISSINSINIKKTWDFSIEAMPEFIWDRMASMIATSNIEYDGIEMCSGEETELNPTWDKNSRLASGTITLLPKGEYIINRSYNCS